MMAAMMGPFASVVLTSLVAASEIFAPHPTASKSYFESTTIIAYFPDGTYVQGLVAVSNIGLGNHHGACRLMVMRPGQPPVSLSDSVDSGGWHYEATPRPTLRVGTCRVAASTAGTQLDITLQDVTALISLDARPEPRVPPGFPFKQGDVFLEEEVLVPFARAEVVLAHGATSDTLRGYGYADHSRSNAVPADLGRGALRFRGFKPGCSTLIQLRFPAAEGPAAGFLWRESDKVPSSMSGWTVELPPGGEDPRPVKGTFVLGERQITIQAARRLVRAAPLEDYGLLGKVLGAMLGNMVNETYDAVLNDGACTDVHGVLELDHNSH